MAKILLVEDYDQLSRILDTFLKIEHHQVVTAENGARAFELFQEDFFDLVITDLWMPELDGVTLIREIKRTRPQTKVLAITGSKGGKHGRSLADAIAAGADATLFKPFGRNDIFDVIDRLLPNIRDASK